MKNYHAVSLTALAGGAVAFVLRLAQNRTGFEADTGLPLPGNCFAVLLPVFLAALALALFLLTRRLPGEREDTPLPFTGYFSARNTAALSLMVAGVFLWGLSGLGDIVFARIRPHLDADMLLFAITPRMYILLGVLTALSAGTLYVLLCTCRGGKRASKNPPLSGNLLLVPAGCLLIRLVLVYREDSVNPSLTVYYVEILALSLLILALYRASSFAFHCGRTRRFALYAACALVMCIATLADGHALPSTMLYLGGAALMLGLLLMRAEGEQKTPETSAGQPDGGV